MTMANSRNYLARRRILDLQAQGISVMEIARQSGLGRKTLHRLLYFEHWGHHQTRPETLAAIYRVRPPVELWYPIRLRCGTCGRWRPCACDPASQGTRYLTGGGGRSR